MDEAALLTGLANLPISALRYYPSTGSTNLDALTWAEAGAADGSLVVADEQTSGRGRLQRQWITQPGAALAFTLVLRPTPSELPHVALISPLGALAVCEALIELGLPCQIKWPNDVLVSGRKVCGVLAESDWAGGELKAVVLGIGINVSPASLPPTHQLNFPAACLETELRRPVDRVGLLAQVLRGIFGWRPRLGSSQFLQAWEEHLAYRGKVVHIENTGGAETVGKVKGINPVGSLVLIKNDGQEISILAGDVRLRPII